MREDFQTALENDGDKYLEEGGTARKLDQSIRLSSRALDNYQTAQTLESAKATPDSAVESRLAEKIEATGQLLGQAKIEEAKTFEAAANRLAEQGKLEAGIAQMEEAVGVLQSAAELVSTAQEPLAAAISAAEDLRDQLADQRSAAVATSGPAEIGDPSEAFGDVKVQISLSGAGSGGEPRRTRSSPKTGDW